MQQDLSLGLRTLWDPDSATVLVGLGGVLVMVLVLCDLGSENFGCDLLRNTTHSTVSRDMSVCPSICLSLSSIVQNG